VHEYRANEQLTFGTEPMQVGVVVAIVIGVVAVIGCIITIVMIIMIRNNKAKKITAIEEPLLGE
jgi:hypothetical protein